MLVKLFRKLKGHMDRDRDRRQKGQLDFLTFLVKRAIWRLLIQIIIFPHWLFLGPFKTFTEFARKDEGGMWIDSYNEFVITNRITLDGILAIFLIALVAILVFIYLPILYI